MPHRPTPLILGALAPLALLAACGADPGAPTRVVAADPTTQAPAGAAGGETTTTAAESLPVADAVDLRGQAEVTVDTGDNVFTVPGKEQARVIRVDPGTKVTWKNVGANPHNVTPSVEGSFAGIPTGKLDPSMSAAVVFSKAGSYPYYCAVHGTTSKGQRGLVVVGDA